MSLLLDGSRLSEWIFKWPHASDAALRTALFEAGKRIREYKVPVYVLDSDDEDALKEIFFRVNKSGNPLKWPEVYDALYGHEGPTPASIGQLSKELSTVGMGTVGANELTSCLLAIRGLDVTRTLADHRRKDPNVLRGAAADALPIMRQVLSFLRSHAGVPHLRLLPRAFVMEVLGRFFAFHSEPGPRTLDLLTRWVWRVFLGEGYDERTLRRQSVAAITSSDEEGSAQALLGLVRRDPVPVSIPETFDARAARGRLALLAMAALSPREFTTGVPIDMAALIEWRGAEAFRVILPVRSGASSTLRSPANRVIDSGSGSARNSVLTRIRGVGFDDTVLASHGINPEAAQVLDAGRSDLFLEIRSGILVDTLRDLGKRLAGWGRSDRDRPSIQYLLRRAGAIT